MNPSTLLARARSLLGVLLLVAAPVVLASCASDEPAADNPAKQQDASQKDASQKEAGQKEAGQQQDAPEASPSPGVSDTPSPTPTTTPSLPAAADGESLQACADGSCEIRVTPGSPDNPSITPLPDQTGFGSLEVVQIDGQSITIFLTMTRSKFVSGGGCPARFVGPSGNAPSLVLVTCRSGDTTTLNNEVGLEVVGIVGKDAVIRIRDAE